MVNHKDFLKFLVMLKTKVAIVSAWYAPYRVPLLREIAKRKDIDLTVIFCTEIESGRSWSVPRVLPFKAVFLKSRTIVRYKYHDMFGDKNAIRYPFGLFHALRDADPEVVVAYEFRLECLLTALYSLMHKCAYVTWSDTTESFDARMGSVRKLIRRALLSISNALIGSSSDTIDYFHRSFSYPLERSFLSILSSHVDELSKSLAVKSLRKQPPEGNVRFLYVGQLIPRKGVDLLITAFSALKQKFSKVLLTIVGDGPERISLENLSTQLRCGDKIIFKGDIPHDKLWEEMVLHDVFVFPTRLDVFGLVVAEAVACGLPVICSHWAGAARDLVADNGMIVTPENIPELVLAMEKLVLYPDLRVRMANAGQSVLEKHNLMSAVQGFLGAVEKAASMRS